MLKDALNYRQQGLSGIKKDKRQQPWFLEAERLCQVMVNQGTTQTIAQPANAAERVAIERAKSILGIK
jgi:hypothetical protein